MGLQNLSETEYAAVKDEVWNNMVRKSLIEKQAEAIGLKVTEAELQYVIETGSSPLLASTPFANEITGEFDVDYLRSFLSSYVEQFLKVKLIFIFAKTSCLAFHPNLHF